MGHAEEWTSLATQRSNDIRRALSQSPWSMSRGSVRLRDSELRKALVRIDAAADAALGVYRRADESRRAELDAKAGSRLVELLRFEPGRERLDAAIERFNQLDGLLIECADREYLAMKLQSELAYEGGTSLAWSDLYDNGEGSTLLVQLLDDSTHDTDCDVDERVRRRLLALRWTRSEGYRLHRARLRMKMRYLWLMAVPLAVLVLVLGLLVQREIAGDDGGSVLLVAVSGALGATMSGAYRLRDELVRGSDLREFQAALVVQPLLGAAAALVVFLVFQSRLLELAGDEGPALRAAVGFVAGFSEPFLLGVVRRIAG